LVAGSIGLLFQPEICSRSVSGVVTICLYAAGEILVHVAFTNWAAGVLFLYGAFNFCVVVHRVRTVSLYSFHIECSSGYKRDLAYGLNVILKIGVYFSNGYGTII